MAARVAMAERRELLTSASERESSLISYRKGPPQLIAVRVGVVPRVAINQSDVVQVFEVLGKVAVFSED